MDSWRTGYATAVLQPHCLTAGFQFEVIVMIQYTGTVQMQGQETTSKTREVRPNVWHRREIDAATNRITEADVNKKSQYSAT